jgi:hypothetical protein
MPGRPRWPLHQGPYPGSGPDDGLPIKENPAYCHGPRIPDLKLKVIPYTVNFEPVIERLIALGVNGIITDDHDLLVTVAIRHGLR